jgi:hypothetical protein
MFDVNRSLSWQGILSVCLLWFILLSVSLIWVQYFSNILDVVDLDLFLSSFHKSFLVPTTINRSSDIIMLKLFFFGSRSLSKSLSDQMRVIGNRFWVNRLSLAERNWALLIIESINISSQTSYFFNFLVASPWLSCYGVHMLNIISEH